MKKVYLTSLVIAVAFSAAFSQGVSGGIRAGMNVANLSSSVGSVPQGVSVTTADTNTKVGFQFGAYLKIMTSEKFGIQPELIYSQMGASAPTGQTGSLNLNYLSIPVLLRFNVTKNFSLQAGPQLGVLLAASQSNGSTTIDTKDATNATDLGGAFGFGLDFGKFNVGARYYLGFSNLIKDLPAGFDIKQKTNAFQLVLGYQLFGK
jgi:hypothetical protein